MKKIVSILLILSIVFSLIVVPAISVSAAETTLFKTDTQSSPYTISNYSSITADDLADQNITIGGANIYLATNSTVPVTPSMTVSDDGSTLIAKYYSEKQVQSSDIYILPESVPEGVKKATVTLKIKPLFQDASGNDRYAVNDGSNYIQFGLRGKKKDGSYMTQRTMNWYAPTKISTNTGQVDGDGNPIFDTTYKAGYFQRGAGAGATSYSSSIVTPVTDSDGFYNLMLSSYKDASGTQYAYIYDMNNNGLVVGYHSYSPSAAKYVNHLGHGLVFSLTGTTKAGDLNHALGIALKDVSTSYEYSGTGSTTASGMNLSLDSATNIYSFANAIGAPSSPYVLFKSASDLTTGYVVNDFSIKSTTATYGTGTNYSCTYYVKIGSEDNYGLSIADGRIGSFNTSLYSYNLQEGKISTSTATGPAVTTNPDGWHDLRVVATCSEESGYWSYAVYDRNGSTTEPLIVRQSRSKEFKGLYFGYYIDLNSRSASSSTPSKPNFERTVYIKDLHIYSTDNYTDLGKVFSSCYYDTTTHTSNGMFIMDDTTVRYDTSIYINTNSSARAILALYDGDGNEIASVEKTLGNGLYEFTAKNPFTATVEDTSDVKLAILYIYDGSSWITSAGEYITDEERYTNFLSSLNGPADIEANIDEIETLLDSAYFTLYHEMRADAELNTAIYTTATSSTLSEFKEAFSNIVYEYYLQNNSFNIDVETDLGGRRGVISVDKANLPEAYGLIEVYDASDKLLKKYTVNVRNGIGYYNIYSPKGNPSRVDITLTSDKEGLTPISEKKSVSIEDIYLPSVFITEFNNKPVNTHYPDTTTRNSGASKNTYQFIELYNYSDTAVDLSEYTFVYNTAEEHKFDFLYESNGDKILSPGELFVIGVYTANSAEAGHKYDTDADMADYWEGFNAFYNVDIPVTNRAMIACVKSGDSETTLDGLKHLETSAVAGVTVTAEIRKGSETVTKVNLGDDGKTTTPHSFQFIPSCSGNEEKLLFASGNFPYALMNEQKLDYCQKTYFSNSRNLKVISYNVYGKNDSGQTVAERYPLFIKAVKEHDADIMGLQEVNYLWKELLSGTDLSDYDYIGGYSTHGQTYNSSLSNVIWNVTNPIFYRKDKFILIEGDSAYLTPDGKLGTKQWDSVDDKRSMTWVVLQDKETGKVTTFINTHLILSGKQGRVEQVKLLYKKGEELKKKYGGGIVIVGDHNFQESTEPYQAYINSGVVKDSKYLTTNHMSVSTIPIFGAYSETYGTPIDFCFVSPDDYKVEKYQVVSGEYPEGTASDHSAIYVELLNKDLIHAEENLYEIKDAKVVTGNNSVTATATAEKITATKGSAFKAVAAAYDVDNRMTDIKFFDIDTSAYKTPLTFHITSSDAKSVKWFIWETGNNNSPVSKCIETTF